MSNKNISQKRKLEHWEVVTLLLMLYDFLAIGLSYFAALWVRFDCRYNSIQKEFLSAYYRTIVIYAVFCIVVFWFLRLYKSIWRFASYAELLRIILATAITGAVYMIAMFEFVYRMPISYFVFGIVFQFCLTLGIRFAYRFILLLRGRRREEAGYKKRVMLVGAGAAGQMIFRDIKQSRETNEKVYCFIDDNSNKWGRYIDDVPVFGGRENIMEAVAKFGIEKIYVAIPSADAKERREILRICNETQCELLNLPGIYPHIDFDSRICAFADFIAHKKSPYDDNGHGTCVAGILAGSGRASMGKYKGMAPGSRIAALKVLDRFGNGNKEDVLQAFRWILQNRERYKLRIVNISVGTTYRTRNEQDVLVQGVERLWDEGLVVVAAAGNQGPKPGSVTAPGCSKKIITVGSSDMLSGKQAVSGRGPTFECVCKPDLVAPGRQIMACTPGAGNLYSMKSGTSMSTPLVSGAIALALEKDSLLSNVEIKMMLRDSCDDMGLPRNQQGWGKFNCKKFLAL